MLQHNNILFSLPNECHTYTRFQAAVRMCRDAVIIAAENQLMPLSS